MPNRLVFDLETDNLYTDVTRIHCLSIRSTSTSDETLYADQPGYPSLEAGLSRLASADVLIGHNIVQFDLPVIKKLYPSWTYTGEVRDTLLAARLVFTDVKGSDFDLFHKKKLPGGLIGSHKLEAWGYRLGVLKGDYGKQEGAWEQFTPELGTYCSQDTAVTLALYRHLAKHGISIQALRVEQELAEYLFHQEQNGWPFDVEKAQALQAKLAARREELGEKLRKQFGSWTVNLGTFTPKANNKTLGYVKGAPCQKIKVVTFDPDKPVHIANRLKVLYGWKPTVFTEKTGQPKIDRDILKSLKFPNMDVLLEYLLVRKRLEQLAEGKEAWLHHYNSERSGLGAPCIHGRINQLGTVTHRATHSKPNISQVPKVSKPYGTECRSLFGVPEGWLEVGCDMSGIELRCLAHYMARYDGGEYARVVSNPDADVHTVTRDALDLAPTEEMRDRAKTAFYCLLYGGGDEKFGRTVQPGIPRSKQAKAGKHYRALLFKNLPALGKLIGTLENRSYLTILDGRRISVRHEHARLNSLLQATAAVLARYWITDFSRKMVAEYGPQGWQRQWAALGWSHDEIQIAARPSIAEDVGKLAVASIEQLEGYFDFRCPVTGKYKVGKTWADCH